MGLHTITVVLVAIIAVEHLYFLYVEMFSWTSPSSQKAFGTTAAFAEESKTLAANQGLYNGFLAAGLVWSLFAAPPLQQPLEVFFAACVLIAGVYGGLTVTRRILMIQALPAAPCLISVYLFG